MGTKPWLLEARALTGPERIYMHRQTRDLLDAFLDEARHLHGRTDATVEWYRSRVTRFLDWSAPPDVTAISSGTIEDFLAFGHRDCGWSSHYARSSYSAIRQFLKWCTREGHTETNPALVVPWSRAAKTLPKRLPREDASRFLEQVSRIRWTSGFERIRNRAIFAVMLLAGLRAGEVLRLQVADMDLRNRVISVRRGKGGKDRLVPFGDTLGKELRGYLEERGRRVAVTTHIFVGSRVPKPMTYRGLARVVHRVRRESGIRFSPHQLRHTYASLMLEGGCDLFSLSKLLGHEEVSTTSLYLSVSIEHLRNEVSRHPLERGP